MPHSNHRKKFITPTERAVANVAERTASANKGALDCIAATLEDVTCIATSFIDTVLEELGELSQRSHYLDSIGLGGAHLETSTRCWQHIKYCMALEGRSATLVTEALHEVWRKDAFPDKLTHESYLEAAGLEELCKNCLRTVQDVIGMHMILHPEDFELVLDKCHALGNIVLGSRLRHSCMIMKRYLSAVGQQMMSICWLDKKMTQRAERAAQAQKASSWAKPEDPSIPGQASSSIDPLPADAVQRPADPDAPPEEALPS
jgi:hypothetical protein